MSRVTRRDLAIFTTFTLLAIAVAVLGISGHEGWAVAVLGVATASVGVASRLGFAARRQDIRTQLKDLREVKSDVRRGRQQLEKSASRVEEIQHSTADSLERQLIAGFHKLRNDGNVMITMKDELSADMLSLRSELRGMRVAQQLMSQAVSTTRLQLQSSINDVSLVADDVQGLHQLFGRYMPLAPLPPIGSSGLRAGGAFIATDLVERRRPELVWCVGGLLPALWTAYALRRIGGGAVVLEVSSAQEAAEARALFASHGLTEWTTVQDSDAVREGDAGILGQDTEHANRIDFLIVDDRAARPGTDRLPSSLDLDSVLAKEAVIVVSMTEDPDVQQTLRNWLESESRLTVLASPRADVAVLEWDSGLLA